MSTRFHDKWHGANHNSVSAIGIPDAGRDPIASYVFPFEGEFIMNNSPRNNEGNGHSEFSSADIFNKWILSANRIDNNIVRSQQDEPTAEIVLSAQFEDGNRVVQTLHGTDNVYNLEVSGADNYEKFDCSFDETYGVYRHKNDKSVGVKGDSIYTISIDANKPSVVENIFAKEGHEPPVPVEQQDYTETDPENLPPTRGAKASVRASYKKVINEKKDADEQLVELRVTDTYGYCDHDSTDNTMKVVDCAGIDGYKHKAYLDVGRIRADVNTDGNISVIGYDVSDKNGKAPRNEIYITPGSDGGVAMIHYTQGSTSEFRLDGRNVLVRTDLNNSNSKYREDSYNHEASVVLDRTLLVGRDDSTTVTGERSEEVYGNKSTTAHKNLSAIVTDGMYYDAHDSHTKVDSLSELHSGSAILAESNAESTYKSDNSFISLETPNGHVFMNGATSVAPHSFKDSAQHEYRYGTELASDRIVVSAFSETPAYNYFTIGSGPDIFFENSYGRIPNLNTTNFRAEKAWFTQFEATSGIVHFIDIVQSDVSGFDIIGITNSLDVPNTVPSNSRLHMASAGIWNDRWMYTSGDALFDRNVTINQTETVKHGVDDQTILKVGSNLYNNSGEKVNGKYAFYSYDAASVNGDLDVSANIRANNDLDILGNSRLYGECELGFGKAPGAGENTLKVSGDSVFNGNVHATKNLVIDQTSRFVGAATFESNISGTNIFVNGDISATDSVSTDSVSAEHIVANDLSINEIRSTIPSNPIELQSDMVTDNEITVRSENVTELLSANEIKTPSAVVIKNGTVDFVDSNSVAICFGNGGVKNGSNCIAIGDANLGNATEKKNTILIGSGFAQDSNILQFHNAKIFTFNEALDGGLLSDDIYSFYDNDSDLFHLAHVSANTISANWAQLTEADLGKTTVHDGLSVIGSSGLFVEGNAYITSSVSAREFYIIRNNGEAEQLEAVPLSIVIEQSVSRTVGDKLDAISNSLESRSVYEPPDEAIDAEVIAVAEQVDEAEHVSYVFSAEKIENYSPLHAVSVNSADAVASAGRVSVANDIDCAKLVKRIDHVDVYASADKVETSELVDYAESAKFVHEATLVSNVLSATSVSSCEHVDDTVEVYNANVVTNTEEVQKATGVMRASFVKTAENVGAIRLLNGNTLHGPAMSRTLRCGGEIPVDEWVDYYRTESNDLVLAGKAIGWDDEDYDLNFTVRVAPSAESLYAITVSADKEVNWIGTDGTKKKFKAPVSVKFRVSKEEITAKLEA